MNKIETKRYNVLIWLNGINNHLDILMTEEELTTLKLKKKQGKDFYFETTNELSDRFFVDITEIICIKETLECGEE